MLDLSKMNIAADLLPGIEKIMEISEDQYAKFMPPVDEIRANMNQEFADTWEVLPGNKYIKLVNSRSVWGFIVATDTDKKFKRGDILKAAGYKAPARNFARGNVLAEDFKCVRWTGAM